MGQCRIIKDGSMYLDCCQGNSTIILSFERETGKWNGWKELEGNWEFGETGKEQRIMNRRDLGSLTLECDNVNPRS